MFIMPPRKIANTVNNEASGLSPSLVRAVIIVWVRNIGNKINSPNSTTSDKHPEGINNHIFSLLLVVLARKYPLARTLSLKERGNFPSLDWRD
ncbi:MAG: hypothetical protein ACK41Q_14290 [Candidatus Brocadia sp.]